LSSEGFISNLDVTHSAVEREVHWQGNAAQHTANFDDALREFAATEGFAGFDEGAVAE
jgi:hypothetical protein